MATHSNTLAWKIPWTEETGWLQSMRSQRVGHDTSVYCKLFHLNVLVQSNCHNETLHSWGAYKQQKFIFHSSGGWEVQDHGRAYVS